MGRKKIKVLGANDLQLNEAPYSELIVLQNNILLEIKQRLKKATEKLYGLEGKRHMILWPADKNQYPGTIKKILAEEGLIEVELDFVNETSKGSFYVSPECIGAMI